ncbi:MAG: UDP-N-acetylmuramoyl-tripeptide--D-alanyl-D-alanine ligase [Acidimicrobiia bacterium]|nr:UDP-N-acetylmuramoyl-tripeptide--D-alanyl-D-alanine ligase [Acidimicrobiia bacterium]
MTLRWDLAEAARVTGGMLTGEAPVSRVVTDSREAGVGDLFVAIRGERLDGHDFAAEALDRGAAVLVEHRRLPSGGTGLEVRDTLEALRLLAAHRRDELDVPVIAVTGSSGKTSTKDLVAGAMGPDAHAALRSMNNEIGVPMTVLGAPDDASALVLEVGARKVGDIRLLAPVVRPDVAVITLVGRAHLETFGDEEGVLTGKWELVEALGPDGVAVLPVEDERLTARREGAMVTFGETSAADVAALDVEIDDAGRPSLRLATPEGEFPLTLAVSGLHQARNAAAAVAAALAAGRSAADAVAGVASATGSPWRMEVVPGRYTVVNDAYNANPDSAATALRTVAALPGRPVAVLGEMLELGDDAARSHREIGELARDLGYAAVLVVGDDPGIAAGAGAIARRVADDDEARRVLGGIVRDGDVVLVKASRSVGLEDLAAWLAARAADEVAS